VSCSTTLDGDQNTLNDCRRTTVTVTDVARSDLRVRAWTQSRASPGERINYIVEYQNTGPVTADGAAILVGLDSNLTYVGSSSGSEFDTVFNSLGWTFDSVPANAGGCFHVRVDIRQRLPRSTALNASFFLEDFSDAATKSSLLDPRRWVTPSKVAQDPSILLNGAALKSNPKDKWVRKYGKFARLADATWIRCYLGSLVGSRQGILDAMHNIATDMNGLTNGQITSGHKKDAITYSAGTRTEVTALRYRSQTCERLILISPISGPMPLDDYRRELEYILDHGLAKELVIYQSENDHLPFFEHYQAYFGPDDPLRARPNVKINPEAIEVNGRQMRIGPDIDRQNHEALFWYINGRLEDREGSSSMPSCSVAVARDPNAKYGPEGEVAPDQLLEYWIEYENEGEGKAFDVYFTDRLSDQLDETTLEIGAVKHPTRDSVIAPVGRYDTALRTVTWQVGEVGSKQGGIARLAVRPKSGLRDSTEIINYAIVYFPSVPETTYTNGVVSIVIRSGAPGNTSESIAVSPNPFVPAKGHTRMSFFGASIAGAQVQVYNKAGEHVKSLQEKELLDWDATGDDGKPLASGVYIYVAKEKSGTLRKGKLAIIR
jgi:uncharacterized repeat protein (TIGR01451 family)